MWSARGLSYFLVAFIKKINETDTSHTPLCTMATNRHNIPNFDDPLDRILSKFVRIVYFRSLDWPRETDTKYQFFNSITNITMAILDAREQDYMKLLAADAVRLFIYLSFFIISSLSQNVTTRSNVRIES